MISLLSTAAGAAAGLFISVLKALFSMLTWFLGLILKLFKMLFCFLPVSAVATALLFVLNLIILVTGNIQKLINVTESNVSDEGVRNEAEKLLLIGNQNVVDTYNNVKQWWMSEVYPYNGTVAFIFLVFFTAIMLIPVATVLLTITVFESYGKILFIAVVVDAVLYVIRAILGKSFTEQFMGRYYKMFPEAGKRHYEKKYTDWLKKGGYEEAAAAGAKKRRTADDFYGEDYPEDEYDDYDEDYEDDDYDVDEYEEYEEYDDRKEYVEYEDYDDYDEDEYNDEYIEDKARRERSRDRSSEGSSGAGHTANVGAFNFFAGCNSKESVERKYKSLVKLYHPDNMDGDTAALQEINVQYAEAKKRF